MKFASTRLIACDVAAMVGFYEHVTGVAATWLSPEFAEIILEGATLAIGSAATVALFAAGSAEPAANRSAIIEFRVADVDADFARLAGQAEIVCPPKLMPWGNRACQLRDPEGTLVGLFTPSTEAARTRFAER